jgi:hypothetical protein
MDASTALWLLVVVGGPVLLAFAIIFGISRKRNLSPSEKAAQTDAVDRLYERRH